MIACDNEECSVEWFHYACVNLTKKPVRQVRAAWKIKKEGIVFDVHFVYFIFVILIFFPPPSFSSLLQ